MDDLDDLLMELGGGAPPPKSQPSAPRPQTQSAGVDDLDSLLNDLESSAQPQRQQPSASRSHSQPQSVDELDDLLNDLQSPRVAPQQPQRQQSTSSSSQQTSGGQVDDLDDLLNDLNAPPTQQPQRQQPTSSVRSSSRQTQTTYVPQQPQRQQSSTRYSDAISAGGKGDELDDLLRAGRAQSSHLEEQRKANEQINALLKDESRVVEPNTIKALRTYKFSSGVLEFECEQLAGAANVEGYRFRIHAKRSTSKVFPNMFAYRLSNINNPTTSTETDWAAVPWEAATKNGYERQLSLKLPGMLDAGTELVIVLLFPPFHEVPVLSLGPIDIAPLRRV